MLVTVGAAGSGGTSGPSYPVDRVTQFDQSPHPSMVEVSYGE